MKFLNLLLLFVIYSCSNISISPELISEKEDNVNNNQKYFSIVKFTGMNDTQLKKYKAVEIKTREILSSKCFKDEILSRELIQTNNKNNQEVYDSIQNGYYEFELNLYYKLGKVQGFTYPNSNVININNKFHKNFGNCSSGANLAHELTHKFGYGHDFKATRNRPKSVPYTVGSVFKYCCDLTAGTDE